MMQQTKSTKNRRWTKALFYTLLGIGIIMIGYQYSSKIITLSEKGKLKQSSFKTIVYGNVNGISKVQKSSRKWISYAFTYKNRYYHKKIMDVFSYNCEFQYKNKLFPIVIDSLHPETNFILFHKRDYKYFDYAIPENMKWVFDCIKPLGVFWLTPAPISPNN